MPPDFKTIADFRKDKAKAFEAVFRQFHLLCRELGLFGGELVAIDGRGGGARDKRRQVNGRDKLKAVNNVALCLHRRKVARRA